MAIINSNLSACGLVEKYVGTAYDNVKLVAGNMDDIDKIAECIDSGACQEIIDLGDNITIAAALINYKGIWDSGTQYVLGDSVLHNDLLWLSNTSNLNSEPTSNNADWKEIFQSNIKAIETLAELPTDGVGIETVVAKGLYSFNDGGAGIWSWNDAVDKSTANLGTIIDPEKALTLVAQGTGAGLGCWVRMTTVVVSPEMWGAPADGINDDSPAIQAAVTHIQSEVELTKLSFDGGKRYVINTQIEVNGKHPISFVGSHGNPKLNEASTDFMSGFIGVGSGLGTAEFMFSVTAYDSGQPHKAPSVHFIGLSFADSDGVGQLPPQGHEIGGAIHIGTADLSVITLCGFSSLKGCAIKTNRFIMGTISYCSIRECGNGDVPAIWFAGTVSPDITQALTLTSCKIESNYGEYIKGETLKTSKITGCSFEANDTALDEPTAHTFIHLDAASKRNIISNNSFNRNGAAALKTFAEDTVIQNNTFAGNYLFSPPIDIQGALCKFTSNHIDMGTDAKGMGLRINADYCTIAGNTFSRFGSIFVISSRHDINISNNEFIDSYIEVIPDNASAWDSAIAYTIGNYVLHLSKTWECLINNTNSTPSDINGDWGEVTPTEHQAVIHVTGSSVILNGNYINNIINPHVIGIQAYREAVITNNLIQLFLGTAIRAENNAIISHNHFRADDANAVGIELQGNNAIVTGNNIARVAGTKIIPFNEKSAITNNIGYITERSGKSAIPIGVDQIAIDHGLDNITDIESITVSLTNIDSTSLPIVVDGVVTSTQFIVKTTTTVTGNDIDFYWHAQRSIQHV